MKKPYLKEHSKINGFVVWIVDGEYIRKKINFNFTNYGQHYIFSFIPPKELCIDKENQPGEEKFFIKHLLVEYRLMSRGMKEQKAIDLANQAEERERNKSKLIKKTRQGLKRKCDLLDKIRIKKIKKYCQKKIDVWIVDGELIRGFLYIDFTEGGHYKIYDFIPKNEIWLDNDLKFTERKYVFLHELIEMNLMPENCTCKIKNKTLIPDKNYKKIYEKAHKIACQIEKNFRLNPKKIDKKIKEELKKTVL